MSSDSEESAGDSLQDESNHNEKDRSKDGKVKPRKRTKTGCLTCRKRRIKCGEERPICKNCIKSKRDCAGYNPPLSNIKAPDQTQNVLPMNHQSYHQIQHFPFQNPLQSNFPTTLGATYGEFYDQPGTVLTSSARSEVSSLSENSALPFGSNFEPISATLSQGPWSSASSNQGLTMDGNSLSMAPLGLFAQHPISTQSGTQAVMLGGSFPNLSYGSHTIPFSQHTNVKFHHQAPAYMLQNHLNDTSFNRNAWQNLPLNSYSSDSMPSTKPYAEDANLDHKIAQLQSIYPSSPLLQEQNRGIFRHFLDVVGPCMSIFDRLESAEVPAAQTMVWTNGLPKIALRHPALAHAILAIGAQHLSRLGEMNDDVAVEHFTFALQKVKVLLEAKATRGHVATLATILLLAYYEVITGDHARWSLHISGAARLVMENNYASIMRTIRWMRKRAQVRIAQRSLQQPHMSVQELISVAQIPETLLDDRDWDTDQDLTSMFMGMHINYDTQIQPNFQPDHVVPDMSVKEADEFRILVEMYWWYCKQDLFQSLLSGDAPMLSYSKWKFCPPRGQVGLADKPYATVDHLWLILARIVEFGYKDRRRKLRMIAANGGNWQPPPGFLPISPEADDSNKDTGAPTRSQNITDSSSHGLHRSKDPPVANESRTRTSRPSGVSTMNPLQSQAMYGMLPVPEGPVHMSSSFKAVDAELQKMARISPTDTSSPESSDIDLDLQNAIGEHKLISEALIKFRSLLPDGFEPFQQGSHTDIASTPFGPALRYRTPTIAAMWAFYLVARIVLRRMHPHSHPAAMVSAGINAPVTAEDAQTIGRICAGLFAQHDELTMMGQMDHMVTAALIETSFSLLFAGVQFQDPAQRQWTVTKMKELTRKTGWASSIAIATACEATWFKMGEAGKGLPYERTLLNHHTGDARFAPKDEANSVPYATKDDSGPMQEHESRFVRHDRNLIGQHTSTRAYWALGLLSVEDDLKAMNIGDQVESAELP